MPGHTPGRLTRPPEEQVSPREYPSSGAPVPPVPEASSHGTHSPGASHAAAGLRQAFPPAPARNVPGSLTRGLLQSPPEIRGSARCLRAAPGTAPSPHCAHCRTLVWFTGRGRLISMRLRLASGMMRRQSLRERGSAPRGTGGRAAESFSPHSLRPRVLPERTGNRPRRRAASLSRHCAPPEKL